MKVSSSIEEVGPNILPIPPALEFPFPRHSADSSRPNQGYPSEAPSVAPIHHAPLLSTDPSTSNGTTNQRKTSATPGSANLSERQKPRPRKRRFNSERPVPAQRASLIRGLRRDQTGYVPPDLHQSAGGHVSDDSTSSSDEDEQNLKLASRPSRFSRRSRSNRGKSGSVPEADRRREKEGQFGNFSVGNDDYKTKGRVSKRDGRLNISVNETNNRGYLAHALGATLQRHLTLPGNVKEPVKQPLSPLREEDSNGRPDLVARLSALSQQPSLEENASKPSLNIVIMVIGSRGDIQPFLKVGKLLKEDYRHRVRIATHPAFKEFVEQDSGLEFFSVGGDPAELMAFMVKNPGLVPSVSTVKAGEIGRRRDAMFEMFQGFWRACINATDDEPDTSNLKMMGDKHPFVADAIIANPPSFAHIHCAERLGVPLHLMFTFPYSPTQQFPHPLANIKKSNVDTNYTNFMSYPLVEMMTWQGLGDLVNRFRVKTLGLEPVSTLWAPGQLFRLKVPYTYMWSPSLIPKPADWGPEIDISGFVFLDLASSFKPPETLTNFLEAGKPPVYIGFGSIVVDDPDRFTSMIFEAIEKAGVRALVSKGWGGLGDEGNVPENVYMLENTPHDWLFPCVSAVVHHGGAGTTAIGLKCGKPTMIVPFFGDQPFWGAMVSRAGAGAQEAIPYKRLTVDKLAEGIKQCLSPEAKTAAEKLAEDIAEEGDGAKNAVESFHRHLPMRGEHSMRCSILPDHVAVWTLKHSILRLSALAADLLIETKKTKWQDLRLVRHHEWNDFEGPGEPLTGGGAALLNSASGIVKGVGGMPVRWARSIKKKEKHVQKQKKRRASSATRRSVQMELPPKLDGKTDKNPYGQEKQQDREDSGELSHGGQHGAERHLPTAKAVPGAAPQEGPKHASLPNNGEVLNSAPTHQQHQQDDENDDAYSDVSVASGDHLAQNLAEDTGAGLAKTGEALAKVPMDLSLAIAQGFHNAPRLYGDSTVRTPPRISGIKSGLRAAGSEFAFGVYDGVTGLVKQPYDGARQNGALGFVQGVGKGIGGFVLKDLAAIIGPFAYTLKGVHKELIKSRQPTAFIRKARMIQGGQDARTLMAKQRELTKVDAAWRIVSEIRKEDERQKEEGLKGRVKVANEKRNMDKSGGFETVGHAKKALETKQEERRERENSMAVISSGEEKRSSKIFAKKGSLLRPKKSRELVNGDTDSEAARSSAEERRGSRIFAIKESLLRPKKSEEMKSRDATDTEGTDGERKPKGADRQIERQVLDLGKGKVQPNGTLENVVEQEPGLANGTANAAA